jgi:hypothetical protein
MQTLTLSLSLTHTHTHNQQVEAEEGGVRKRAPVQPADDAGTSEQRRMASEVLRAKDSQWWAYSVLGLKAKAASEDDVRKVGACLGCGEPHMFSSC